MKVLFAVASLIIAAACNVWFVEHALTNSMNEICAHFQEVKK